ncbi:NAD(P)H-dependent glycerol-3-phosphate dehydrogenase [Gordonia hirsuta DSM 44140 = NBRC 16056]|uniref:Glycerol-3-phosphate dehydrogenase [NAD(P)+] n=1 Tax=Gordonia hirsuta DSM 44140 = NBRC 16056 TaxID=1121927 RepID=L7LAZ6_9ACTN|nr:NAD(P)H-dependent glycerol-3-phosphate dehydrogenase [Gordonia hirsuta DSM 44140 = NBRC 16056]
MRAVVMGSGSWGTAVAKILADAGNDVTMWARQAERAEAINRDRENAGYLPGIRLPDGLRAVTSIEEALADKEIVVCAVPSQVLRENLAQWKPHLPEGSVLVSLAKGVEVSSGERMSQVIKEVADLPDDRIAVLSGPNLAREIAEEQPAATVIACIDEDVAKRLQHAFAAPYFRPYTNTDVIGVEIGGAAKNVIALACGMAAGMGFGENTLATLITRGLAETMRLGIAMGADVRTLAGLAGIGDLVATCSSPLSRNRTFGARLGEGATLEEAQAATHGQVAEGVKSCRSVRALAHQYDVEMPLTDAVYRVCHEGMPVQDMVGMLLGRTIKPEV